MEQNQTRPAARRVVPAADIQELPQSYIVRMDMPGASRDAIKAQIEEGVLTVEVTVDPYFAKDATLLVDDSLPIEYHRKFSLAEDVDQQAVDAAYDLGVLTITLNKKQHFLPRQISIQ
ncbi:MAG: Hsp20/alpha crystallin family protein [Acidobacteriota bacterium]